MPSAAPARRPFTPWPEVNLRFINKTGVPANVLGKQGRRSVSWRRAPATTAAPAVEEDTGDLYRGSAQVVGRARTGIKQLTGEQPNAPPLADRDVSVAATYRQQGFGVAKNRQGNAAPATARTNARTAEFHTGVARRGTVIHDDVNAQKTVNEPHPGNLAIPNFEGL